MAAAAAAYHTHPPPRRGWVSRPLAARINRRCLFGLRGRRKEDLYIAAISTDTLSYRPFSLSLSLSWILIVGRGWFGPSRRNLARFFLSTKRKETLHRLFRGFSRLREEKKDSSSSQSVLACPVQSNNSHIFPTRQRLDFLRLFCFPIFIAQLTYYIALCAVLLFDGTLFSYYKLDNFIHCVRYLTRTPLGPLAERCV